MDKAVKLIRRESWYKTYNDDAKVVSMVTDFKVYKDCKSSGYALSFPIYSLDKVLYNLERNKINYRLVFENISKDFGDDNNYDNFRNGNLPSVYYVLGKEVKRKVKGSFKVQFEGEDIEEYIIGENINNEAELVKKILSSNINDIMDINGNKVKLIDKNIE